MSCAIAIDAIQISHIAIEMLALAATFVLVRLSVAGLRRAQY